MPDNTTVVAPVAPVVAPPAEAAPTPEPAAPVAPATPATPVAPVAPPAPSEADLNAFLAKMNHEELKKLPEWNKILSRLQNQSASERGKLEAERQTMKREMENAQLSAWQYYFASMPAEQRVKAIDQDPKLALAYATVKAWEASRGAPIAQNTEQVASNIISSLYQRLQMDDTWSTIISEDLWKEVTNTADPAEALKRLVDAGRDFLTKAELAKLEERLKAVEAPKTKEPIVPAGAAGTTTGPETDQRTLADPSSSAADKRAAFKRLHGIEYTGL